MNDEQGELNVEKIPTLFLRNPENMKLVTQEVNPEAAWVLEGYGIPTVKKDGTNIRVTVKDGKCVHVEKRRNPTKVEKALLGAEPGYVDASRNDTADKHIFAAVDLTRFHDWPDGAWSCEALGPKIQGGIEASVPCLYSFTLEPEYIHEQGIRDFDTIRIYLETHPIEGIVWHDQVHNRYAKVKRRDFGMRWPAM